MRVRERDREREEAREKHQLVTWLPFLCALTGDATCNPNMYPDQELSPPQSFGTWYDTPVKGVTQPGQDFSLSKREDNAEIKEECITKTVRCSWSK